MTEFKPFEAVFVVPVFRKLIIPGGVDNVVFFLFRPSTTIDLELFYFPNLAVKWIKESIKPYLY